MMAHSNPNVKPSVYPGVKMDCDNIGSAWSGRGNQYGGLRPLLSVPLIVDLPFSFVLETLLLPFDVVWVATSKEADHNPAVEPTLTPEGASGSP